MKRFVGILGLAAIVAGCVPSLNPVYTDADLAFEPWLIGTWTESDSSSTWEFSKAGPKKYALVQTDSEGHKAAFEARLVKLKEHRFLDIVLTEIIQPEPKLNGWAAFSLVPGHLILHVPEVGSTLKIAAMNPEWLKEHLEANPDAIAHRKVGTNGLALIASTKELQQFVLRHVGGEGLFGGPMELEQSGKTP